jgi:hypothetical protein
VSAARFGLAQPNLSLPSALRASLPAAGNLVVEGSTVVKRGNRLRRAAIVLALLVFAAIVTGVAQSTATTAVPKLLAGNWEGPYWPRQMVIGARGKVEIGAGRGYHGEFSHVTAHKKHGRDEWVGRLSISGIRSCSGTGTYRWTITNLRSLSGGSSCFLKFTEIHDACQLRVNLLTGNRWGPHNS